MKSLSSVTYKAFAALMIVMLTLVALPVKPVYAVACNATVSGNWSATGTWSCGHVPTSADDVTINATRAVSFDAAGTSTVLSLTVNGTLNFNNASSNSLTVSGSVVNAGTIAVVNQTGTNTHVLNVGGNFTNNGTFTPFSSNDSLNVGMNGTAAQTIGGTTATVFNDLTISNTTVAVTATNNFSINGTMTVSANTTFNASTFVVSGGGAFTIVAGGTLGIGSTAGISGGCASGNIQTNGCTYSTGANYVYNGTANQNTGTGLPNNLTGTVTINNPGFTVTLSSGRSIASGGTVNIVAGTFAAGTNLAMASTSNITRSGGTMTGTPQGAGLYNVTYTGNSMTTSSELSGSGLNNITVNLTAGQTLTLGANATPRSNLSVSSGSFDLSTFTINRFSAGGTLIVSNGATLKIGGTNGFPTNYNTHTLGATSTVTYAGTNQTVSVETYGNLNLSGSGLKSMAAGITVGGNMDISGTAQANITAGVNISPVNALSLGGVGQAGGTWGHGPATPPVNQNTTYFSNTTGYLTITTDSRPTPTISGVTASQTITYGTATVTLSGTVSAAGPIYPAIGETVGVTINGVLQNTTITTGTGGFTINYNTSTIPYSATAYTITYSYGGNTNLQSAANNTSTALTVNQASSSVTVTCTAGAPYTYTGSAQTPCTAQATGVGMSPVNVTSSLTYLNNTNAGSATANASWAGDANHTGNTGSGGFTIGQASSITTVICPASVNYTGAALTPCSATVTGAGSLSLTPTPIYANNTAAGINTASASYTFIGDANHTGSSDTKNFTINKATSSVTVTCPVTLQPYSGSAQTPCTASYSTADGLSGSLVPSYSNNTNVGTATANASYAGDTNHASSSNSATFDISMASSSVTVTCPVTSQPYSGSAQTPCTASYSTADGLSGSLVPSYSNNTNVGTATANASYAGDTNHASSSNSATFDISMASSSVTVTCPVTSQPYTGSTQTPCTASYSTADGLSGSLVPSYSNNTNVGTATANASYAGDTNHASSNNSATFDISMASSSVTVTCPVTSQPYTGSAQTPCTASYSTADGLSGSLVPSYSNNTNVGTATANASYAGDTNHASSSNSATFDISMASSSVTVTCPVTSQPYSGSAQTPCTASYSTADGLSGSLVPSYSNNTNVGTATANASYAGDTNHSSSSNSATFAIGVAALDIKASSPSMTYGGAVPTVTPIYSGLQGSDTAPSTPPTCSTTATTSSPVGNYPSSCSGAADSNYSITYTGGMVAVGKAGQTINISPSAPSSAIGNATFSVGATATSGLTVDITTSGACSGSGSGSATITMSATVGTCTVHYNQAGNANYDAAPEKTEDVSTLAITSVDHTAFTVGAAGTFTVTTNGAPTPSLTETGTLPAWLSFTDNGDGTATLAGTPPTGSAGTYPFVFKASNGTASDVTQSFTLTVSGGPVIVTNGVDTTPDTGDGHLAEFEIVTVGITKFSVTFNHDVVNVPSTDPNYVKSVINPSNYILVNDNGDGFQTVDCKTGVNAQDFAISVDSVSYSNNGGAGPFIATLNVNSNNPLANGNYRLYTCGTTSITDLGGLKLAGDGKDEGTDFTRNFIVQLPDNGGGNGNGGRGNGGGAGGGVGAVGLIPVTGFAPGHSATVPAQPSDKSYSPLNNLRLTIPSLGVNIPIVGVNRQDVSWDLTWLGDNAGYLDGSAYPTWVGNTVLTGHVVNADGKPGAFAYIKDLQVGDKVYVHLDGQIFVYEVRDNREVMPTALSTVFKHETYQWLTLVTCEDYNNVRKSYNYRRMVRAVLISVIPEK